MASPQTTGGATGPSQSGSPTTSNGAIVPRVWTPWRMRYVGGEAAEAGCIFCNRFAGGDDIASLILARGERVFAMMNLYPYNSGHLMLAPVDHVAGPEEVDPDALVELSQMLPRLLGALRRAMGCDGFNIGLNVGAIAGAGVADHMHQHIVPRWQGDANFMPILASTMVLPELIPVTYAKIRAELARPDGEGVSVTLVILADDDRRVLIERADAGWRLPRLDIAADQAIWRAVLRFSAEQTGGEVELAGWAGAKRVERGESAALTLRAIAPAAAGPDRWLMIAEATAVSGAQRDSFIVRAALDQLAPSIGR